MCIIHKKSNNNGDNLYITYKCIEQCPTKKILFNNKNGFKSLLYHYGKYHSMNTTYQHISQQKLCDDINCRVLISNKDTYCRAHEQQQQPLTYPISEYNNNTPYTMIDKDTIIDADRRPFDVYRVIRYFKCNEHIKNEDTNIN